MNKAIHGTVVDIHNILFGLLQEINVAETPEEIENLDKRSKMTQRVAGLLIKQEEVILKASAKADEHVVPEMLMIGDA